MQGPHEVSDSIAASSGSLRLIGIGLFGPLCFREPKIRALDKASRQRPKQWGLGGGREGLRELPLCAYPSRVRTVLTELRQKVKEHFKALKGFPLGRGPCSWETAVRLLIVF